MAFESEHVPELIQGFHKIQQRAFEKQAELNARYEQTQAQAATVNMSMEEESKR